jgi:hypothetical protein
MREIGMGQRFACLADDLPASQADHLKIRPKVGEIIRLQGEEEAVGAMVRSSYAISHARCRVVVEKICLS